MDEQSIIEKWAYRIGVNLQLWPLNPEDWSVVEMNPHYRMIKEYMRMACSQVLDTYFDTQ